jgi:uncharacterized membrane-anchored protein
MALFALLILIPAFGYRLLHWNGVFAFWFAYVLTRPLGASLADWLGKPVGEGGVGLGAGWVSLGFAAVMLGLVVSAGLRAPAGAVLPKTASAIPPQP